MSTNCAAWPNSPTPRIVVDTAGLSPKAPELANRLAESIGGLSETTIDRLLEALGDGRG